MSLPPSLYRLLQEWVHRGHHREFAQLQELLPWSPGDVILEVGCGTGEMARHFVKHDIPYVGVDLSSERIAQARRECPDAHFVVGDVHLMIEGQIPRFQYAFCHQVLHHLDDASVRGLLTAVAAQIGPSGRFVAIEPELPEQPLRQPLSYLLCCLDDGRFMRTLRQWRQLFGTSLIAEERLSMWPRWPVASLVFVLNLSRL